MPSKYSVLLFDLDGTVADTDEMIVQTMLVLYGLYNPKKVPSREEMAYFSGPPIRETLLKEFPDQDQEKMFDEFHRISWSLYATYVTTYPHIRESLLALKEKGFHLGIVTNKLHKTSLYCLNLLHLDDLFEIIVGLDDVHIGKPNSEGVYKAMKFFHESDPHRVLYIGDNESDYLTSHNSGIDCALVTWGPRQISPNIKPTYFIDSFIQLEEVVSHE